MRFVPFSDDVGDDDDDDGVIASYLYFSVFCLPTHFLIYTFEFICRYKIALFPILFYIYPNDTYHLPNKYKLKHAKILYRISSTYIFKPYLPCTSFMFVYK